MYNETLPFRALIFDKAWQEGCDLGKECDDDGQNNERNEEWDDPFEDDMKGNIRSNTLNDKYIYPDRRREYAHLRGQDDDHPEPDGTKAQVFNNREEDRDGDNDQAHRIHEATADEIDKDDNAHDRYSVNGEAPHPICKQKGN